MPGTLRGLAWSILALEALVIVLRALPLCNPNAAGGDLGCYIFFGMIMVLLGGGASLFALILGITACRAASRSQRGGWFVVFLWLTMLLGAMPTLVLLILNVPKFQPLVNSAFVLLWAMTLLTPALALLTLIYLRATAATEQDQTVPAPHQADRER